MTEHKKVNLTTTEVFADYDIALIERESGERVDVSLYELADIIAKKAVSIFMTKL